MDGINPIARKNENIVLVGFPGTGKTTVGRLLVGQLAGWQLRDTDALIEEDQGMPIPGLFSGKGEAYFRQVESRIIAETMQGCKQVISTGGGAVLAETNRRAMLAGGFVVALAADVETILRRVREDSNRPLFHGDMEARVRRLMQDRHGAYDFADLCVPTSQHTAEEVARIVLQHFTQDDRESERGAP
jgi:shikimate kinase